MLGACGGSTKSTPPESEASGGVSPGAGGSSGATGVAGRSNDGAGAGTGGKVPDFPGGAPNTPLSCSAPYAGPSGGPRVDGPIDLGNCEAITDQVVLARYKDGTARVPQGLYYESTESITFWNEPCSKSPEETVARGPTDGLGTFVKSYSTDWFYEAVYCFENNLRRVERNLRCDYFDGTKLAMPTPERLAFLASLMWWGNYNNLGGSVILGHSITSGDATDLVEICSISATMGDFGLCDEVRLESTTHRLMLDGTVELGTTQVIRTLKGDCH